ncbi:hypothetical protein ACOCJL_03480 [Acinetobacter baumannii]|uniref:hypothetical protein n=1 Tax=Acinetobacter baumannii TaxID=470 RepID=UPI003B4319CA
MSQHITHKDLDTKIQLLIKNIERIENSIISQKPPDDNFNYEQEFVYINLEYIKPQLKFLSIKGKENIIKLLEVINDRILGVQIQVNEELKAKGEVSKGYIGHSYGYISELGFQPNFSPEGLEYEISSKLTLEDMGNIIDQIISSYPNLNITDLIKIQLQKANEIEREAICEKLIVLRNEAIKHKAPEEVAYIKNLAFELNLLVSSIGLEDQVTKINNASEILDQITASETAKNISKIEKGYQNEAKKLYWPILLLNIAIIFIFLLIITVISLKFYAYFYHVINTNHKSEGILRFLIQIGKRPEDFIFFFSLIFSISALETYLIRERKRLIKLRDYFLFCDLELSSMPQYMRELNLEQRQNLYIDLSKNYFKGGDHDSKQEKENTDNISDVLKKVEELTKIVKELKNN